MSTKEEISEVFNHEISVKSDLVRMKQGILPFLDGIDGFYTFDLLDGILSNENLRFIQRIK